MNIWQKITNGKTAIGLAPMDGVTDAPFRYVISKYTKPDLMFTEFVNVDSIFFNKEPLVREFIYHNSEFPLIAQIFGIKPEYFYVAAQVICELGFSGVDINMGCPSKNVSSRGAGAGLINNKNLAKEIIIATKEGVSDWVKKGISSEVSSRAINKIEVTEKYLEELNNCKITKRGNIAVSVKTRIGYKEIEVENWISTLIEAKPDNISIHGRTFKQLYSGSTNWEAIKLASKIIKEENTKREHQITVFGNGDIKSKEMAMEYAKKYSVDGILIGRAVEGNPWVFLDNKEELNFEDKIPLIIEHCEMQEKLSNVFFPVRKHLAWYVRGFDNAVSLRKQLVLANSTKEVAEILKIY